LYGSFISSSSYKPMPCLALVGTAFSFRAANPLHLFDRERAQAEHPGDSRSDQ
jgi:hypothetical protein